MAPPSFWTWIPIQEPWVLTPVNYQDAGGGRGGHTPTGSHRLDGLAGEGCLTQLSMLVLWPYKDLAYWMQG